MHLSLAFSPRTWRSSTRSSRGSVKRAWTAAATRGDSVLPVLVHGDAAFAGQGVVMERWRWRRRAATTPAAPVHLVINNQIGFTTSDPRDTRSTLYCTDVVKMIEAPVLHVNGDDPEAVVLARRSLDYRQEFNRTSSSTSSASASSATTSRTRRR